MLPACTGIPGHTGISSHVSATVGCSSRNSGLPQAGVSPAAPRLAAELSGQKWAQLCFTDLQAQEPSA